MVSFVLIALGVMVEADVLTGDAAELDTDGTPDATVAAAAAGPRPWPPLPLPLIVPPRDCGCPCIGPRPPLGGPA